MVLDVLYDRLVSQIMNYREVFAHGDLSSTTTSTASLRRRQGNLSEKEARESIETCLLVMRLIYKNNILKSVEEEMLPLLKKRGRRMYREELKGWFCF
jgi:hypothetical protein